MVRIKHRYILFKITPSSKNPLYRPSSEDILSEITQQLKKAYGDYGCGSIMPVLKIIFYDEERSLCVLRIPRDWSLRFQTFLVEINHFYEYQLNIKIHHISGTVDQLQRWLSDSNFHDVILTV